MDANRIKYGGVKSAKDQQAVAQVDTVLVQAPRRIDQAGTVENDSEAEHVVVGIEFSVTAALNFFLHTGVAGAGRKSITHYLPANAGDYVDTFIKMGKGNPIRYTSSAGTLSLRVRYITIKDSQSRTVAETALDT